MAITMEQWQKKNDNHAIDWYDLSAPKYYIKVDLDTQIPVIDSTCCYKTPGVVYFSSRETVEKALNVFYTELVNESKAKTGYERVSKNTCYYFKNWNSDWSANVESGVADDYFYNNGNYYNDTIIAKNNCLVDKLMSRMRQWQALNDNPIKWQNNKYGNVFYICYDNDRDGLTVRNTRINCTQPFVIYFSSKEKALECMNKFKDELEWYFTEYYRRLDEKIC